MNPNKWSHLRAIGKPIKEQTKTIDGGDSEKTPLCLEKKFMIYSKKKIYHKSNSQCNQ